MLSWTNPGLSVTWWHLHAFVEIDEYENRQETTSACCDTNINKQTNCSLVQFIRLVYLDGVNKNADPTLTLCGPEPLLLLPCLINLSSKQKALFLTHWMGEGFDERKRGRRTGPYFAIPYISLHLVLNTTVEQTTSSGVSLVISLHFSPTQTHTNTMNSVLFIIRAGINLKCHYHLIIILFIDIQLIV